MMHFYIKFKTIGLRSSTCQESKNLKTETALIHYLLVLLHFNTLSTHTKMIKLSKAVFDQIAFSNDKCTLGAALKLLCKIISH